MPSGFHLEFVGSYATDLFNQSASEIAAFHPSSKRLFVVNGSAGLDVLDISKPAAPAKVRAYRKLGPNSVAVHGDLVAAAFAPKAKDARGEVIFLSTEGEELNRVRVGFLPDMVAFTPDGKRLIVANEGEAEEHGADPEGSVSIIDLSGGPAKAAVREATFASLEPRRAELERAGVHLPVPGKTLAQQFEPEYIAIAPDGRRAFVTVQEANAVCVVDLESAAVIDVIPLGFKDFSKSGLDASDKDGRIDVVAWPVVALRQPDAVVVWQEGGATYLALAEEGEPRDTPDFSEVEKVAKIQLDPIAFPLRESHEDGWSRTDLVKLDLLGRLEVSKPACDTDGDGDADRLVAFGGRGVSVWRVGEGDKGASLVWDSGSAVERTVAERMPKAFNASNDESPSRDSRSKSRGPEPEGLAIAEVSGRRLLFAGIERAGGVLVWDVTNPSAPTLLDYANRRDPSVDLDKDDNHDQVPDDLAKAGDLGPEGLLVIPADKSPDGTPLLVVCNEVSGTTTIWRIVAGAAATTDPRKGF